MTTFITVIHILTALLIVLLVLMQDSKGGGLGIGGGSTHTVFGTSGASSFLVKTTRWLAVVFAGTSISLASYTSKNQKSVTDSIPEPTTTSETFSPQSVENPKSQDQQNKENENEKSENEKNPKSLSQSNEKSSSNKKPKAIHSIKNESKNKKSQEKK